MAEVYKSLLKVANTLIFKCKLKKLSLKNFSILEKYPVLICQNMLADKAYNPQSIC